MAYELFGDEWAYVTVLRHPVDRWFSDYFYNKSRGGAHSGIVDDLGDFVESDRAAMMGRTYPRYLVEGMERMDDPTRVSECINVLKKFALIGSLENLDLFVSQFEEKFGRKLVIGRENSSPVSKDQWREAITPRIRERVEELCQPDLYVYNYVLKNLL